VSLLPKETIDELRDALIAVAWSAGVIICGIVMLMLTGILFNISQLSTTGVTGAVTVLGAALAVGWAVYRRQRKRRNTGSAGRSMLRTSSQADRPRLLLRPMSPKPQAAALSPSLPVKGGQDEDAKPFAAPIAEKPLDPRNPSDRLMLKTRFEKLLAAGNANEAESIINILSELESEKAWCEIRRRLLARKRSGQ
jgi:hypothetical protein